MSTSASSLDLAPPGGGGPPARPYAPSWVNVLARWLEALPGPTWLAYATVIALVIGLSLVLGGPEAATANGGAFGLVYYAALPLAALGLIHLLDRTADRALTMLRPLLAKDDTEVERLRYQLTVAPARPAAIVTVFSYAITPIGYVTDPAASGVVGLTPVQLAFRYAWESLVTAVFLILVVHTIRQLRLIDRVHAEITAIDVFDQGPLYGFSQVTATTSVGLIVLLMPSLFLLPTVADVSLVVITVAWYGFAVVVAATAFVLPLRGMHDRLVAEKRRLQRDIGQRISRTVAGIGAAVDGANDTDLEVRQRELASLVAARDVVDKVPTWPWSAGAFTGFASAIVLPIVLFLAQRALSAYL